MRPQPRLGVAKLAGARSEVGLEVTCPLLLAKLLLATSHPNLLEGAWMTAASILRNWICIGLCSFTHSRLFIVKGIANFEQRAD